jgi:hypothetical protein
LFNNLRLKLLALFFAVALWSVVAYASNPTQDHKYKLAIDHPILPSGLVVVGDLPQVPVTVIGSAENLQGFDSHSLRVTGNFSKVKVGVNQVPILVHNSDANVQIDAPDTVPVSIDQLASTNLTPTIERVNALTAGYHEQTNATTITPSSVRVDGPKSLLNGIQAVVMVDLAADVQAPGVNKPYPVVILDANKKSLNSKVTITPPTVTVKMVIQADAITVNKGVGWTLTGQPAAGFRVTNVQITPLQVQATGLQNTLGNISVLSTDPVDIANAKADVIRTVTIRPPDGVTISQKTAVVHVFISPAPGVSPTSTP